MDMCKCGVDKNCNTCSTRQTRIIITINISLFYFIIYELISYLSFYFFNNHYY